LTDRDRLHTFDFESFQTRHLSHVCGQLGVSVSGVDSIRPCTPTQAGMLAMFINSQGDLYFNTLSLKLSPLIDIPRLRASWDDIVQRNEILRTGFCHVKDDKCAFAMITYSRGTLPVPWKETLQPRDEASARESILNRLHQPPWLISLERLDSYTVLRFSGLHALYDAISLDLVFSELSNSYMGNILPEVTPIGPILGSMLTKYLQEDADRDQFWKNMTGGIQPAKFPNLNPVRVTDQEVVVLVEPCSKSLPVLLEGCRDAGITLQAAGQAAWARLLASYTGEKKATFGVVLSGRTMSAEAQTAVFPCITTLPSSYDVDGSNKELLGRIMTLDAQLLKHNFTPLSRIQRLAGLDSALFDTIFILQQSSMTPATSDLWDIEHQDAETEVMWFLPPL
jgi:hypothetical protein